MAAGLTSSRRLALVQNIEKTGFLPSQGLIPGVHLGTDWRWEDRCMFSRLPLREDIRSNTQHCCPSRSLTELEIVDGRGVELRVAVQGMHGDLDAGGSEQGALMEFRELEKTSRSCNTDQSMKDTE